MVPHDSGVFLSYFRGGYKCPAFEGGYVQVQLSNLNVAGTSFGNTVNDWYRASWYNLHTGDWFNVTGGDTNYPKRTEYTANLRAQQSYTIRFAHPTPNQIALSLNGAYNGAWAVIAVPYPANTNFTIITGALYTSLTRVDQIEKLGKFNYYWDNQHLYLRLENTDNYPVLEEMGFSWESSYGSTVYIKASCSPCDVSGALGATPNPALPAPFVDASTKYQVSCFFSLVLIFSGWIGRKSMPNRCFWN